MMSFSGHPVCHIGLNWCILLGLFLLFATKIGNFGNTGLFHGFFTILPAFKYYYCKIIQMHLGLILDLYNVYSISHGFCSQISMFSIQIYILQCVWSFDLQMCISNRLCLFFFQNNVF